MRRLYCHFSCGEQVITSCFYAFHSFDDNISNAAWEKKKKKKSTYCRFIMDSEPFYLLICISLSTFLWNHLLNAFWRPSFTTVSNIWDSKACQSVQPNQIKAVSVCWYTFFFLNHSSFFLEMNMRFLFVNKSFIKAAKSHWWASSSLYNTKWFSLLLFDSHSVRSCRFNCYGETFSSSRRWWSPHTGRASFSSCCCKKGKGHKRWRADF